MSGDAQQQQGGALQRHWFTVLAGVLILAIVGVFGYNYMTKEQIPVMKALNDFSLDNINGSTYTFSEGKGKVRLVEFMFTNCPDICPATTYNMSKLQDQLKEKGLFGDKVEFVSITFDPDFDTPEVLKAYAEKFKADQSGWKFLRGDAQAIEKVTKDFGIAVMKQPDGSFAHTARMFLVDEDGNMRRAYGMAAEMDMDQMMKEMVQLAD
ncbi:SCO family protein [Brevibacillus centrosporus]|uniref:Protein SCO1/2 n=1 Tax=Brevibacillus centrosporus TaxID=54910 RepID=A0A1I3XWT4_9BACL|nr:SCO family protein [Brevibacillus centrosporus]MEC2128736.1 SCO family protein [Brevibacillus centrosporus]MED4910375.1 SCO family protein [Brevibacillus centrosporus]RNB71399.1 SCO family protein [Brevibacillus centrosporus]SFK23990.1 protein SCO1/2 [Brevibacillus centrosporus]GED30486.1 lipoprotein [Brevibacillus centrosporus]